jgi:hypothetical protein
MIDSENQRMIYGSEAFPEDQVAGYTIQQVERSLKGATSWNAWRDNLINQHQNASEESLNELFSNWY